jgi:hypothetical protein
MKYKFQEGDLENDFPDTVEFGEEHIPDYNFTSPEEFDSNFVEEK